MLVKLAKIVADIGKIEESEVSFDKPLSENGIDSMATLLLINRVERIFDVVITDSDVYKIQTLQNIIDLLTLQAPARAINDPVDSPRQPDRAAAKRSSSDAADASVLPNGLITSRLEIGMPLTGRNNLAEGPFLQQLGDLRWTHMCSLVGVKSKNIVDEQNNRLYSTFFYVEIAFPEKRPMASFGENDTLNIVGDLKRFGTSMLDGNFYLFPEGVPVDHNIVKVPDQEALSLGVAVVRLSNVFVMQFNGAEWLKKSRPSNAGFLNIAETFDPFTSYGLVKTAEKDGLSYHRHPGFIAVNETPARFEYKLVPDRDLNGAGLVYFANYPVFLDVCERQLLEASEIYPFEDDLIDRRTLVSRRSAYLNNASSKDTLEIEITAFIENPFASDAQYPELAPIRLIFDYRMFRKSDGRLMMVSSAEKTIYGRTAEDLSFYSSLEP
jgi:probable biosynthetic protein (TIGR04098 family)